MRLTADEAIEYFNDYIFENRARSHYVRQTAPWIPFIVYGLDKLGCEFDRATKRLLRFRLPGDQTWYVAAYHHRLHGIGFTQNKSTGSLVRSFTCIGDARSFYDNPAPPRPQHIRLAA